MDEETRSNAFKPFFTTKGDSGTGLGLAIVDQIIGRAGGRVRVESEPGNDGHAVSPAHRGRNLVAHRNAAAQCLGRARSDSSTA
jgi:signal transduction histidine kinase